MLLRLRREHRFSWFSGGLYESAIFNFFHIFPLLCNIVILRSLHRYGEYWRPRSQSDCRYFGSCVIILKVMSIAIPAKISWAMSGVNDPLHGNIWENRALTFVEFHKLNTLLDMFQCQSYYYCIKLESFQ